MNKNRIEGRRDADELAQHSEVDGPVAEVNAAVVPGSNAFLPGEIPTEEMPREVSRGRSTEQRAGGWKTPVNEETGRLDVGKDRTGEWASDRGKDIGADDTRMGEATDECRPDGKHGMLGA